MLSLKRAVLRTLCQVSWKGKTYWDIVQEIYLSNEWFPLAEAGVQSYDYNHSRAGAAILVSATHSREPLSLTPFLSMSGRRDALCGEVRVRANFLSVKLGIQTTQYTFSSHSRDSKHNAPLWDSTGISSRFLGDAGTVPVSLIRMCPQLQRAGALFPGARPPCEGEAETLCFRAPFVGTYLRQLPIYVPTVHGLRAWSRCGRSWSLSFVRLDGCTVPNVDGRSFGDVRLWCIQIVTEMLCLGYMPSKRVFWGSICFFFLCYSVIPRPCLLEEGVNGLDKLEEVFLGRSDVVITSANKPNKCAFRLFGLVTRLWICF